LVKPKAAFGTVIVSADGEGLVSDAGTVLLAEVADRAGLTGGLCVDETMLFRVRAARASTRERAWDAGARPDTLTLDIDATLLTAHSEKDQAAGNYKHGYGFHPIGCWLAEIGEALAAILRPGNAGCHKAGIRFSIGHPGR